MCTAISYKNYFGRNLDYEHGFGEQVIIVPRNHNIKRIINGIAIIGIGTVIDGYPLFFDAVNEYGLGMAGLNFPENAYYHDEKKDKINIAPYELILYILSHCKNSDEAEELFKDINIENIEFSPYLPNTPLHWFVSDGEKSLCVEQTREGLKVYENSVGVLTNNPTFDIQMFNLNNFSHLSAQPPKNRFSSRISFNAYSRGLGALGMPGDLSSQSRFIRAVFTKFNSVSDNDISQFFHILSSVEQQKGCVKVGKGYEYTIYTSCCDTKKGIYYYKTYNNFLVNAVDMHSENLNSDELITYPIDTGTQIKIINKKE